MIRTVLMLDPRGDLNPLARAFRQVIGDCLIHTVATIREVESSLAAGSGYHLLVVDLALGNGVRSGCDVIRLIRSQHASLPVVAAAAQGDVETAAEAVAAGASDFLVLGPRLDDRVSTLLGKVHHLIRLIGDAQRLEAEKSRLSEAEAARYRMWGSSPQMRQLLATIERVAAIPRPVLIVGERGTGKELVARAIHAAAGDTERPIVAVNCAAFSDPLLETELFGHEKGAFTGAERTVPGKFELADRGTLFLDEIGCMSLPFQQKILRVVEYGVFTRVGGGREISTSARIVAATNADLAAMMERGTFLRDLYDRLSFEVIEVPPLRERAGDVEALAQHFLNAFMLEIPSLLGKRLSASAMRALKGYSFPGNVREMKNIIERAAYRESGEEITAADLGLPATPDASAAGGTFADRVHAFERSLILSALDEAHGNQAAAARALGLTYHQYRYYLRKFSSEPT